MGITQPFRASSDGADDDLGTAIDGDATADGSAGQPPALADYDPLPEEQSDPPTLLDEGSAGGGEDGGRGGDEYPYEDPSPS